MKRLTAVFITIAILCTSFVFSSAATASVEVNTEKLLKLGLIQETDNLEQEVTRGQFANMIVYFTGDTHALNGAYSTMPFMDVAPDAEYASAVKFLYDTGYITGTGDYRFEPDRTVTYSEAVTIILRVLGYIPSETSGGYMAIASRLKLADIEMTADTAMTKKDIYYIFDNTLYAEVLKKTYTDDSYTLERGENFLAEFHDIYEYTGIVDATDRGCLTQIDGLDDNCSISIENKIYKTDGNAWDEYLGYSVTYWVLQQNDKEVVLYMEPNSENNVTEVKRDDIKAMDNGEIIYYDESDTERIRKYDTPDVIYNREAVTGYGKIELLLPLQGYVTLVDNNGDKRADVIFIYSYRNVWVRAVDVDDSIVYGYNTDERIDLTNAVIYGADGMSLTFADITPGDVITLEESKNADKGDGVVAYISGEKVSGVVEKVFGDKYTIAGKEYELSKDFYGEIKAGLNGIFYIDKYGCVAVGEKQTAADGFSYGVYYGVAKAGGFGGVMLRIFTTNEVFEEFNCYAKMKINDVAPETMDISTINNNFSSGDLIRYKLNSNGEISEIQVPKNNYEDFYLLDSGNEFRYRNYVFSGRFAMGPNGVMFGVPNNVLDEENYYVLKDSDFTMGKLLSYSYKAYITPKKGMQLADALVVYNMGASEIVGEDVGMMLINEIWQVYDAKTEGVKDCIVGYQNGQEVSYIMGDDSDVKRLITDKGIMLSRGDIIRPILDGNGCVMGCEEVFDADAVNSAAYLKPFEKVDTYAAKFDTEHKWVYGYITDIDDSYVAYETRIGTKDKYTATNGIVSYLDTTSVVRYDSDYADESGIESVHSLKKGDICIMYHNIGKVRQIIIVGEE